MLVTVFVAMFIVNVVMLTISPFATWWMDTLLPYYGILTMLVGLIGGSIGGIAWVRVHDYAFTVGASMLPLLGVIVFIIGELFLPH